MERDAHYAAVGIATVALVAALIVFTIWLARLQFNDDYDVYDIVFSGPVNGLSEGGEVHFNGIRVG
ncbi:MAG: transporter substrate-binding protein, partial [Brevundimonas sp.]|nr:transporter substrate-binding protein [Brevundimonas sp.]